MDVLSDAVAAMRSGQPHSARTEYRGSWTEAHPSYGGVGFHVVLRGLCRLVPPQAEPLRLGPGDAVFLPHGSPHSLAGEPDGHVVMLCGGYLLDSSRLHPLMSDLPDIIHVPSRPGSRQPLRGAIDLLAAEIDQPGPGADAAVPALLDALLIFMFRFWFDEQAAQDGTGWRAAFRDPAVMRALAAMHGDPPRRWTVAGLAREAGLSRAAFARRFTTLVGSPPLAYLTWWRMTTAARLLRSSAAPLSAVARQVGYTSEFAFASAFKREYGIAPGRYRSHSQPASGEPAR